MKLPFFSFGFVKKLRDQAETNLHRYGSDTSWLTSLAGGQQFMFESEPVIDPPPSLLIDAEHPTRFDAENARLIYTWLERLTPVLAMEERLWACLAHFWFPEYMAARWPAKSVAAIHRRYLFEGASFAALSRHGIARLWWAGYLTKDSSRPNPFELTEVLFLRQDVQVSLLERSLGKCAPVRRSVLEFLQKNKSSLSEEAFGKRIQVLLRELNLWGGVAVLDTLPQAAIHEYLDRVAQGLS